MAFRMECCCGICARSKTTHKRRNHAFRSPSTPFLLFSFFSFSFYIRQTNPNLLVYFYGVTWPFTLSFATSQTITTRAVPPESFHSPSSRRACRIGRKSFFTPSISSFSTQSESFDFRCALIFLFWAIVPAPCQLVFRAKKPTAQPKDADTRPGQRYQAKSLLGEQCSLRILCGLCHRGPLGNPNCHRYRRVDLDPRSACHPRHLCAPRRSCFDLDPRCI